MLMYRVIFISSLIGVSEVHSLENMHLSSVEVKGGNFIVANQY